MALLVVVRWPLRTSLTAFGILVGVAAVTVTVALGDGARRKVSAQIESLGANVLMIESREVSKSGAKAAAPASSLSERDVEAIKQQVSELQHATPLLVSREQMLYGSANTSVEIVGTTLDFFPVRKWKTSDGATWDEQAQRVGERVCVIGQTVKNDLFGTAPAVGQVVRLGRYPFRVIGVLEPKGQDPFGRDEDARVIMPIASARARLRPTAFDEVDVILLSATSKAASERVSTAAKALLRERHQLIEGMEDDFRIRSQQEFQAVQEKIISVLNTLLISIALVSLAVGGVGIMNIMLVSVSERTKEIGIRLAIGARERDILLQFLVEAVVLSLLGGGLGTLVALVAIFLLAAPLDLPLAVSVPGLLVALGTSTLIGVVFGFFPAQRAARMDPIDALRTE
jgi:putative ABC transport system permease protein